MLEKTAEEKVFHKLNDDRREFMDRICDIREDLLFEIDETKISELKCEAKELRIKMKYIDEILRTR